MLDVNSENIDELLENLRQRQPESQGVYEHHQDQAFTRSFVRIIPRAQNRENASVADAEVKGTAKSGNFADAAQGAVRRLSKNRPYHSCCADRCTAQRLRFHAAGQVLSANRPHGGRAPLKKRTRFR